jgi:hypothetical protein
MKVPLSVQFGLRRLFTWVLVACALYAGLAAAVSNQYERLGSLVAWLALFMLYQTAGHTSARLVHSSLPLLTLAWSLAILPSGAPVGPAAPLAHLNWAVGLGMLLACGLSSAVGLASLALRHGASYSARRQTSCN